MDFGRHQFKHDKQDLNGEDTFKMQILSSFFPKQSNKFFSKLSIKHSHSYLINIFILLTVAGEL